MCICIYTYTLYIYTLYIIYTYTLYVYTNVKGKLRNAFKRRKAEMIEGTVWRMLKIESDSYGVLSKILHA